MEGTPTAEQSPEEIWALAIYARLSGPAPGEAEGLPMPERIRQALEESPSPDVSELGAAAPTPLAERFRRFAETLLGTSPDVDSFGERARFLYGEDLKTYYSKVAARQLKAERLVSGTKDALGVGLGGLAELCRHQPELHDQAVRCMASIFWSEQSSGAFSGCRLSLAKMVQTRMSTFWEELVGGRFDDMPLTPAQRLAVECLDEMNYGRPVEGLGSIALHHVLREPLTVENIYHMRNLNRILSEYLGRRAATPFPLPEVYASTTPVKIFKDAYEILRSTMQFVYQNDSESAGRMLADLPPSLSGHTFHRTLIGLANRWTDSINKKYLAEHQLSLTELRLDRNASLPQAFDRLLYILTKELPAPAMPGQAGRRTVLREASVCIANLLELANIESNGPLGEADIMLLFPDASPETTPAITAGVPYNPQLSRFHTLYLLYREQARRPLPSGRRP